MHGGDSSTCPSRNITKSESISIVNLALLNIILSLPIMQSMLSTIFLNSSYDCHNKNIAIDYIVKVLIIAHNEVYAFDLILSYLCLLIIQTLPSIILNYALELVYIRANLK